MELKHRLSHHQPKDFLATEINDWRLNSRQEAGRLTSYSYSFFQPSLKVKVLENNPSHPLVSSLTSLTTQIMKEPANTPYCSANRHALKELGWVLVEGGSPAITVCILIHFSVLHFVSLTSKLAWWYLTVLLWFSLSYTAITIDVICPTFSSALHFSFASAPKQMWKLCGRVGLHTQIQSFILYATPPSWCMIPSLLQKIKGWAWKWVMSASVAQGS